MKTLVFAFDVSKLDTVAFDDFMRKLLDAQCGLPLENSKYNVYDTHSVASIHKKLDELRASDGTEIGGDS